MSKLIIAWIAYLFALIFLLGGATEYYLRMHVMDPTEWYVKLPGWEYRFVPNPIGTPGISEDAIIRINKLGLRGPLPNSNHRKILAVGGSTTEEAMLNDINTWAGQLEKILTSCGEPTWVGNTGKAGTNARHHVLQIQKTMPRLKPIDYVLVLAGLNDMLYDFRIHHPEVLPDNWNEMQAFMYRPSPQASFWNQTAIGYFISKIINSFTTSTFTNSAESISYLGETNKKMMARRAEVNDQDWILDVPDMTQELENYQAVLLKLAKNIQSNGAAPVFITQPAIWNPNMPASAEAMLYAGGIGSPNEWFTNPTTPWFHHTTMNEMLRRYNNVMLKVCTKNDFLCIDLSRELEDRMEYYYDDFHFSAAGAERVAKIIAAKFEPDCIQKF